MHASDQRNIRRNVMHRASAALLAKQLARRARVLRGAAKRQGGAYRLACDAADRAMQTCGGVGYSRHMPFEHIYRHHRRYRITEGSEEIQMRKVASNLFGFTSSQDRK